MRIFGRWIHRKYLYSLYIGSSRPITQSACKSPFNLGISVARQHLANWHHHQFVQKMHKIDRNVNKYTTTVNTVGWLRNIKITKTVLTMLLMRPHRSGTGEGRGRGGWGISPPPPRITNVLPSEHVNMFFTRRSLVSRVLLSLYKHIL
jgi:hypothetical protein